MYVEIFQEILNHGLLVTVFIMVIIFNVIFFPTIILIMSFIKIEKALIKVQKTLLLLIKVEINNCENEKNLKELFKKDILEVVKD